MKLEAKPDVEVEVGDVHDLEFQPQVKLKRWDNEVNLSVRLQTGELGTAVVDTSPDKVTWRKGNVEAHFYETEVDLEYWANKRLLGPGAPLVGEVVRRDDGTKFLLVDGELWADDGPWTQNYEQEIAAKARGHVLCGGLGFGVCQALLLQNPDVLSVTSVELSPDVIRIAQEENPALTSLRHKIRQGDFFDYCATATEEYDFVITNFFGGLSPAYQEDYDRLKALVEPLLADGGVFEMYGKEQYEEPDVLRARFTETVWGYELETVLLAPPASPTIRFTLRSRDLDFWYQPPLSEEDRKTCIQPDRIVGSYAVYWKGRKTAYRAEDENKRHGVGKAFHIYRPKAHDAGGREIWADLHIEAGLLTISIDPDWLADAAYPVRIGGTTFGDLDEGSSQGPIATGPYTVRDDRRGLVATLGEEATSVNIKAWIGSSASDTVDCKAAINREDSEGADSHGEVEQKENLACAAAKHQETFVLTGVELTADNYVLNIIGDNTDCSKFGVYYVYYDVNGVTSHLESGAAYALDDPWNSGGAEAEAKQYSIYCTYTVAEGEERSVAGNQPAATGALTRKEQAVRATAGIQPAPSGTITQTAGSTFSRTVAGSQPAATGSVARKEQAIRAVAGAQPASSGALTRKEQALRAVAGSQPASAGSLTRKEQAVRATAGAQPAATGTLTRIEKAVRAVAGNQPASTGAIARTAGAFARSLAGDQPTATGALTRVEQALRALAGSQPAAAGTLTRVEQAVRALAGSQPASTGAVARTAGAFARVLAGSQLAATGALTRVHRRLRSIAGSQPAALGTIAAVLLVTRRTITGEQAAPSGTLTKVGSFARSLAGDQPNPTGTLARTGAAFSRSLAGAQPAAVGVLVRSKQWFRSVAGDQAFATGTVVVVLVVGAPPPDAQARLTVQPPTAKARGAPGPLAELISNPYFEVDLSGWARFLGAAITRKTDEPILRLSACMEIDTGPIGTGFSRGALIALPLADVQGKTVIAWTWFRAPSGEGGEDWRLVLRESGDNAGNSYSPWVTASESAWQPAVVSRSISAGATAVSLEVETIDAPASSLVRVGGATCNEDVLRLPSTSSQARATERIPAAAARQRRE